MRNLLWIGGAIGVILGAVALVKLAVLLGNVGLVGVPAVIVGAYSETVDEIQKYLIELPFHITPPPWAKHVAVIYGLFFGSNVRLLTHKGYGKNLLEGLGDR